MPLGIHGSDETLHNGSLTSLATRSILLVVALPTEGLPVLLMETLRTKVLTTQSAEEMLRMPSLVQCTHYSLRVCVCVWGGLCDSLCVCVGVCEFV